MTPTHVLAGVKVLDLSHFVAGPHCTRMMAENGADVIKVESLAGDSSRVLPVIREGRSGYFIQHNRGKRTMSMDLRKPEAQAIIRDLIKQVDVLVENFTPGVMKRFNLDWETVRKINPELIMCSISALGQDGPLAHLPGFDMIGQAYSGVISMTGEEHGPPYFANLAWGDISTGAHAYGAVVTALFHKARGGGGQHLDISLLDVMCSYHEMNFQVYGASDGAIVPKRTGTQHGMVAPLGIFKARDRYIIIIALGAQWENLVKLIGREDMLSDPRFATASLRGDNKQEIVDAIEKWLATQESGAEAVRILEENHVPSAPILSVPEVMAHPHMIHRQTIRKVTDRAFGEVTIPRMPLRFSAFPEPLELQAGFLGEHNREILSEQLGYSDAQITALEKAGILGSEPLPG